jgi:hypothetical protein
MEVSHEVHTLAALLLGNEPPVFTVDEAVWAKNRFTHIGNRTTIPQFKMLEWHLISLWLFPISYLQHNQNKFSWVG